MDLKTLKFAIKNLFYFYFRKSDIKMGVYQKNLIEVREKGYSIIENYFLPVINLEDMEVLIYINVSVYQMENGVHL